MLPAKVTNVSEKGFDFECENQIGNDIFDHFCRGVLVKEKNGKLELFVDKETVALSKETITQ